jgi:hypothetical protein
MPDRPEGSETAPYELVDLPQRPQQHLVDQDPLGRGDRVDDQRRDVLGGQDLGSAVVERPALPLRFYLTVGERLQRHAVVAVARA